jgi:hypothetical protein
VAAAAAAMAARIRVLVGREKRWRSEGEKRRLGSSDARGVTGPGMGSSGVPRWRVIS